MRMPRCTKVPLVFRGTFGSPEQLQKSLETWKAEKSAVGAVAAEGTWAAHFDTALGPQKLAQRSLGLGRFFMTLYIFIYKVRIS